MGGELVSSQFPSPTKEGSNGQQQVSTTAPLSYADTFNQCLPFYLSIGMTYEQFWHGDCTLVIPYRKAFEMKQDRENQRIWLQGRYIYDALCAASPLFRFSMKGGKIEALPYVEEPYPRTEKQYREMQERKEKEQMEKMRVDMEVKMAAWNKAFEEKQKQEENEVTDDG